MKKSIVISVITVLLIGTFSFSAWGFGGQGQGQFGKGGMNRGYNNLNLTLEQQQKMLAIHQDFQKDTLSLRFDLQKKNLELRQLWSAKPLNQTAIDAKTKEVTALKVQMANKAQAMQEQVKKVLTAEQLKQLSDKGFNGTPGFGGKGRRGGGCMGGNL